MGAVPRRSQGTLLAAVISLAVAAIVVALFVDASASVWLIVGIALVASAVSLVYGLRTRD